MVTWDPRTVGVFALTLLVQHGVALAAAAQKGCRALNLQPEVLAPAVASYRMVARLEPERHRIVGTSTMRWQNPSDREASELYLHAYLNAFAHPRTRFMRMQSGRHSLSGGITSPGGLTITRLVARELGNADLLPLIDKHSPNDPEDATDLRVALPSPVAAGASLTIDVEFLASLPSLVERSGFSGTFYAVTQWFPKIARRDSGGTWHHFPYEPLAEFSSDFGDYDVTLDVPSAYVIAAPGIATPENAAADRRREHYCLTGVHDFAWFAWDQFVVTETKVGPIALRHYSSRDQAPNARSIFDTLRFGLGYFSEQFFPYPYSSLTVVHPPDRASAAGAMEYPQLITTGGPWYLSMLGVQATHAVALHELGHQWFYGMLASDEYLSPVLDEGLASWAEANALGERFAAGSSFDSTWFKISESALRRVQARRYARHGPLDLRAGDFGDFDSLAGRIYARFPTLLETIGRVYGAQQLALALRAYARQYRFRHPTPTDFLEAVRPHLQPRAFAALSTSLTSDGWVDYAVSRVTSTWVPDANQYSNRVLIERRGTLDFPVLLEVQFADGHVTRRHLESVDLVNWIEWPHRSPLVVATIDPDRRITIDDDIENQTVRIDPPPPQARLAATLHLIASGLLSLGWP
jgi:hypothetical protein